MSLTVADNPPSQHEGKDTLSLPAPKRHKWRRRFFYLFLFLICVTVVARLFMPQVIRWYVIRVIDQSTIYEGRIGAIDVHLWKGAYTIHDVRLIKRNGNVPVPLFTAKEILLAMEWKNLLHRKMVGRVVIESPELNFVDAPDPTEAQSGVGPWLGMIRDLFPFRINSTEIHDATIHFRAYQVSPPVDVYLREIDGKVDNLTNIYDDVTPLYARVDATGKAMGQADFQFKMKLDPFSYRPSFQMVVRLLGLDVTKINKLARTYGTFDFEHGWLDLVVQADAKEGMLTGYVKPLFRNLEIFGPADLKEDNMVELFWEALLGTTTNVLKNGPRDQFGTMIPFTGELEGPEPDLMVSAGNILRNAFVRAYLPRLEGVVDERGGLHFDKGSILEPASVGDAK
ncbi:MAG TPA: DUF748 domain-containing protein [Tepidisphaeraceae bacterium]|jgi:hypothetical protein|nr:DUF748 domain-containing protein [Tepidisphaeraceae bacterium]